MDIKAELDAFIQKHHEAGAVLDDLIDALTNKLGELKASDAKDEAGGEPKPEPEPEPEPNFDEVEPPPPQAETPPEQPATPPPPPPAPEAHATA